MSTRVQAGLDAKDKAVGYKDEFDAIKAQDCPMPCLDPVAGPCPFHALYLLLCLVATGIFVYSVGTNVEVWQENVVSIEQTVEDEIAYPDVYFCYPPEVSYVLENAFEGTFLHPEYFPSTAGAPMEGGTIGRTDTNDCAAVFIDDTYKVIQGCAADLFSTNAGDSSAVGFEADVAKLSALEEARARDMKGANLGGYSFTPSGSTTPITNFPNDGTKTSARCYMVKMRGANAHRTGTPKYIAISLHLRRPDPSGDGTASKVTSTGNTILKTGRGNTNTNPGFDPSTAFAESYFVAPAAGVAPSSGGVVTARYDVSPFIGHMFIADLKLRKQKDETQPLTEGRDSDDFEHIFLGNSAMSQRIDQYGLNLCTEGDDFDMNNCYKSLIIYKISDFKVEEITIRDQTPSEIISALGGMWGASLFVLTLLFKGSGRFNKKGKQIQVFKYLPKSMTNKYLPPAAPAPSGGDAEL